MIKENFLRIDITKKFTCSDIPLLFLEENPGCKIFIEEAISLYKNALLKLDPHKPIGLAFDDDGIIQKHLSKNHDIIDISLRIKPILEITKYALSITNNLYIALCIEELSPFGYDITDGIFILKSLEELGIRKFLLSAGSRSFPPLFNRKKTAPKKGQPKFLSYDANLASILWIKNFINPSSELLF